MTTCSTCKHFEQLDEYFAGRCHQANEAWYDALTMVDKYFVDRQADADGKAPPEYYVVRGWRCEQYEPRENGQSNTEAMEQSQ